MDSVVRFSHNNDVFGNVLDRITNADRTSLCLVNSELYRATCYAEQGREQPRIREFFSVILEANENALSADQRTELWKIFSEVECGIENPQEFDVVRMRGCRALLEQVKRVVAEVLSQSVEDLPVPQDGDPTPTHEVYDAAFAYKALSEWYTKESDAPWRTEDDRSSLRKLANAFKDLPNHYLQQLFDLLDRQDTVLIRSARVVCLLSVIHEMLYDQDDMEAAEYIFDKSLDLAANAPNDCNIIALSDAVVTRNALCRMLRRRDAIVRTPDDDGDTLHGRLVVLSAELVELATYLHPTDAVLSCLHGLLYLGLAMPYLQVERLISGKRHRTS